MLVSTKWMSNFHTFWVTVNVSNFPLDFPVLQRILNWKYSTGWPGSAYNLYSHRSPVVTLWKILKQPQLLQAGFFFLHWEQKMRPQFFQVPRNLKSFSKKYPHLFIEIIYWGIKLAAIKKTCQMDKWPKEKALSGHRTPGWVGLERTLKFT